VSTRRSRVLVGAAVAVGAAALSALFFAAFFAPGWPRTAWGWLVSAALGLPLLVLGEIIFALCFSVGPPRYNLVARLLPSGLHLFRYPAGSRRAQLGLLVARILAAAALCALVLWLLYGVVLRIAIVRAQFR